VIATELARATARAAAVTRFLQGNGRRVVIHDDRHHDRKPMPGSASRQPGRACPLQQVLTQSPRPRLNYVA
jgi:hypothetical protein